MGLYKGTQPMGDVLIKNNHEAGAWLDGMYYPFWTGFVYALTPEYGTPKVTDWKPLRNGQKFTYDELNVNSDNGEMHIRCRESRLASVNGNSTSDYIKNNDWAIAVEILGYSGQEMNIVLKNGAKFFLDFTTGDDASRTAVIKRG